MADAIARRLSFYASSPPVGTGVLSLSYDTRSVDPTGCDDPPLARGRVILDMPDGSFVYDPGSDVICAELDGVHLWFDAASGNAQFAARQWWGRQCYCAAHTMTTIVVMEFMKRRGRFPVHTACLAREGSGIILAGPSGSGKSTLAVALTGAGLGYLSDDLVLLSEGAAGECVDALGVADVIGITDDTLDLLPEIHDLEVPARAPGFRKRLLSAPAASVGNIVSRTEPRVLVFPRIVGGSGSRLTRLHRREAWRRLVPDVLLTEPRATQAHLAMIARLTDQVECYSLETGRDVHAAARLLANLI